MEQNLVFLPLLLVLFLAFLVPPLLSRVRWIPVVVGEIMAGILIGRSGLNLIRADSVLAFLAEIGLAGDPKSVLIPHGQTMLEYGDHLTLLGGWEALAAVRERLENEGPDAAEPGKRL